MIEKSPLAPASGQDVTGWKARALTAETDGKKLIGKLRETIGERDQARSELLQVAEALKAALTGEWRQG